MVIALPLKSLANQMQIAHQLNYAILIIVWIYVLLLTVLTAKNVSKENVFHYDLFKLMNNLNKFALISKRLKIYLILILVYKT
jgi:hypothetical protein